MNTLCRQLIDRYQKGLPLTARPYQTMADELGVSEDEILAALHELQQQRVISRVGPVFDHRKAGASCLVAMSVPEPRLDELAAQISRFAGVNHNYAREHRYNLWFVATASDQTGLQQLIDAIEQATGYGAMRLPMERSFHIDLGFSIDWEKQAWRA